MRHLFLLTTLTLSLSLAHAQDGFFSGITNAFNNFFGGSDNRPQRPRPAPQQFQQQQFQPQQQQQQFFQPQPQQPQQFQPQPQPQQFQPRPSSQGNPAPVFRPQPAQQPQVIRQPQPSTFGSPQNRYVVTWKIGCSTFEQHEAKAYCNSLGMEPVSLDTPEKQNEFNRLIAQDAQRFFWTGGIVDHANRLVGWSNPASNTIRFSDSLHWSHTGGAGLPQPDNRAAGEQPPHPETCLAILNNFYADGIKWHDVACHHKKPTVCEPTN